MLWAAAAYLVRHKKFHWVCTIPAIVMTVIVVTFIANAKIGFSLPMNTATTIGIAFTLAATVLFFLRIRPNKEAIAEEEGLVGKQA